MGGVLFGWEEARGNRNIYKPLNAERSGSLFFARDRIGDADKANGSNEFGEAEEIELARTKNADGLVGDASLVADICLLYTSLAPHLPRPRTCASR